MTHLRNCLALSLLTMLASAEALRAQGMYLSAAGPVNRGMGGASTAAPLDAMGALYWNPATIAALQPELGFGLDLFLPTLETSSSVAGLSSGTTGGEPGVTPIPNVAWVHRTSDESPLTYGLGVQGVAGFATNYPASTTNPIFTPQSNTPGTPGGLGGLYTAATFLQLAPTATLSLNECWSIGGGPIMTLGNVVVDPNFTGPLDDSDGSGASRYGTGRGTRWHWGGGAQVGVYYIGATGWHYGASIKSPQWMEEFRTFSTDELGRPLVNRLKLDLPMILSAGVAYSGIECLTVALDVRYFDYENTDGLGTSGFDANGALLGLSMDNVFAMAVGVQYQMNEGLYVRLGYTFNENPMQEELATLGVPAPLYYQHIGNLGASYQVGPCVWINLAYSHVFEASMTGPIVTAAGPVPGSSLTTSESVDDVSLGVTVRY